MSDDANLIPVPPPKSPLSSPPPQKKKPLYHIPDAVKSFCPDEITKKTLTNLQLDIMIVELKKCGWSIDQIAFFTSLSRKHIVRRLRRYVKRAAKMMFQSTEDYITMSELNLNELRRALQPGIDRGEVRSIEAALKVEESLRKLKGIDEPERKVITSTVDVTMEQHSYEEIRVRAEAMGISLGPQLDDLPLLPGEVEKIPLVEIPLPPETIKVEVLAPKEESF
jgi:hypothetical protein